MYNCLHIFVYFHLSIYVSIYLNMYIYMNICMYIYIYITWAAAARWASSEERRTMLMIGSTAVTPNRGMNTHTCQAHGNSCVYIY